uniref:Uncharacterized protein n=1 Tax=Fagus sylvatica TaxID=28930 RepID=A0A2N9IDG8_FAGSY
MGLASRRVLRPSPAVIQNCYVSLFVETWVSVHGVVVGLGLTAWWLEGFGFLVLEPWVSAWAWVHRVVVGFSGFCSLGFGARRGGWAWVDGVVVGRVWVFGGGAVGLGLGLGSPADSPPPITHPTATA